MYNSRKKEHKMNKFTIKNNKYLHSDIYGYYHCDYIGYKKTGNPDFLNRLKNASKKYSELDLVADFINVADISLNEIPQIIINHNFRNCMVCVVPRSKKISSYSKNQLLFKKAISCTTDILKLNNGTSAITRIKNTKTTHNWRAENNSGETPYVGITKDTCIISRSVKNQNIILVDDIYTKGINIAEDCIQTLFDFGAKNVILYTIAKTRG